MQCYSAGMKELLSKLFAKLLSFSSFSGKISLKYNILYHIWNYLNAPVKEKCTVSKREGEKYIKR